MFDKKIKLFLNLKYIIIINNCFCRHKLIILFLINFKINTIIFILFFIIIIYYNNNIKKIKTILSISLCIRKIIIFINIFLIINNLNNYLIKYKYINSIYLNYFPTVVFSLSSSICFIVCFTLSTQSYFLLSMENKSVLILLICFHNLSYPLLKNL